MTTLGKGAEVRYLRTAEVAQRLHVHSKTVSRLAKQGRIPHVTTPGGHRRFPETAVVELEAKANEGLGLELAARLAEPVEEAS